MKQWVCITEQRKQRSSDFPAFGWNFMASGPALATTLIQGQVRITRVCILRASLKVTGDWRARHHTRVLSHRTGSKSWYKISLGKRERYNQPKAMTCAPMAFQRSDQGTCRLVAR